VTSLFTALPVRADTAPVVRTVRPAPRLRMSPHVIGAVKLLPPATSGPV